MDKIKAEIMKLIETNSQKPASEIRVLDEEILFENIKYKENQTKELRIENTGDSIVPLEFLIQRGTNDSKGWLRISPILATINPREIFSFNVSACFNEYQTRRANIKYEYRNMMVIIRVLGGGTYTISISANFPGSCFGANLIDLAKIVCPISRLTKCLRETALGINECQEMPKELRRIIEFLKENGLQLQGLFEDTGSPEIVDKIRACLDNGEPFDINTDPYSMCSVLLEFLEILRHPILQWDTISKVFKMLKTASFTTAKEHLYSNFLDPVSSASLQYIINFAILLLDNSAFNGLSIERLVDYLVEPLTHSEEINKRRKQLEFDPYLRTELLLMLIKS